MAGSLSLDASLATHPTFAQVSREAKRAADQKSKWRLGSVPVRDSECFFEAAEDHPLRPYHGVSQNSMRMDKLRNMGKQSSNADHAIKAAVRRNPNGARMGANDDYASHNHHNGGGADWAACAESVLDGGARDYGRGSTAGEPDAGIAYSFDSATGPSDGSDVLTQALGRAVERFEDQKTKRLVRDEYDVVVDADSEDDAFVKGRAVEEDFELVGSFES